MMSKQELAEMLSVSMATLNRLRADGEGPPEIKVGRQVRFIRTDVDAWLRENMINRFRRQAKRETS